MIELFNGSTTAQNIRHFSTKRIFIPTFELQNQSEEQEDFCVCRMQCVPCLKLFTDEIGVDTRKNDFFFLFQNSITGGSHKVFYSLDEWQTEIEITNNDFGTLLNGTNWFGYEFTAFKIWQQVGYKKFWASLRNYDSSGSEVNRTNAACRKLIKYSDVSAHGTITIETRKSGILRHGNNYSNRQLVSGAILKEFRNQIRLDGSFGMSGTPVEETRILLNNQEQTSLQIFKKGSVEYDLNIWLASSEQVMPVILDDMFATQILVTDYNLFNFSKYTKIKVFQKSPAEFQPGTKARRKSFLIKMEREESNIEKSND